MLTKLTIRNFKLFKEVEIELANRVLFVGPNNSGKTSTLQALALWSAGVRRWVERRGAGNVPKERSGVTINRRDLIALPVPAANLLWRDLHVREGYREAEKPKTRNVLVTIDVEGVDKGKHWKSSLEFDYANEESFYCRSQLGPDGKRLEVPQVAATIRLAYLPPMSGLAANERRLDPGAIDVLLGEGRTAEVLRNLCWLVHERQDEAWKRIVDNMRALFGITLDPPRYVQERGEIVMAFRTPGGVSLDLSASGRGQQQTLLLLAHMAANPDSVLLLDEPDAHLEVLRQQQIYQVLTEAANTTGSQIIAASHSEVILNEAADRDTVVAFVGRPHRIDDRGGKSQLVKSLKAIGFDQYLLAEESGWVLYLEGSTDLAILRAFAEKLGHSTAIKALERPFVHYVANQPQKARDHFYGLREAKPDLKGIALYDRMELSDRLNPALAEVTWKRREIECYLCQPESLLRFVEHSSRQESAGPLFAEDEASKRTELMKQGITDLVPPIALREPGHSWWTDTKVTDDFLDPLFERYFQALALPNLMRKTDYHMLAPFVPENLIDPEVSKKLDEIAEVAELARPREDGA